MSDMSNSTSSWCVVFYDNGWVVPSGMVYLAVESVEELSERLSGHNYLLLPYGVVSEFVRRTEEELAIK